MDNGTEHMSNESGLAINGESSKHVNGSDHVVLMDYSTDFPKLPEVVAGKQSSKTTSAWATGRQATAIASSTVTQTFTLAADERANRVKSIGTTSEEARKCHAIAQALNVKIELSESKDGALTIVIKGPRTKVEEARGKVVRDLQTQASREVDIPKEHHGKLIGRNGETLKNLEAETHCKINIPGRDTGSSVIRITGPREGIEKAAAHIKAVSEREAKLAVEHVTCSRAYYPFVRGPNNENIDRWTAGGAVKVNIPPPTAHNEVISITGERDGVIRAAAEIRAIAEQKAAHTKTVTCTIPRSQHRFIIGSQASGLHEILRATGVSVEVPSEEENSDEITLRGDPSRFAEAIGLVFTKASSVITQQIDAPVWLHKHIIGPKGSTLATFVPARDRPRVNFEDSGHIFIEGAPEDVKQAYTALSAEVTRLLKEMTVEKVKVHPSLHRHVIGRGGALISKIKDEAGVQITIPKEATNSDEILVEGKKESVQRALKEIKQIVTKIENEKSRDIIIEHRLHKLIIGQKGESVGKLREQFPNVVLTFPDANKKSDLINIRGDRVEVDAIFTKLTKLAKDLAESNYQATMPVFKEFVKNIIGKGGATIRKIRDDTHTRIDVPDVHADDGGRITVTGKKADVDAAIVAIEKIQEEQASIVKKEIEVPVKVQARLHGGNRRLIAHIEEEAGGVHIKFPNEKANSTKVTVRGPAPAVEVAVKLLQKLVADKEADLHEDTLTIKPEFHRFLIGKGGARVKRYRDENDVRVMFPRPDDTDKETVHLLGKKSEVSKVKADLEEAVKQLNETVEAQINIDQKHHKHFLARGAAVLKDVQEQNGGVLISFPRQGAENPSTVTIKGSKQCVELAKAKLEEIVDDMEHQTSISVEIPAQFHRALFANRGQKIHDIQSKFNVHIKFPERRREGEEQSAADSVVHISGRDTKCEAAKEALLALVPITKTINVPIDMHRGLIGKGGEKIRQMMQDFDVNVNIPKEGDSEEITVIGTVEHVEAALEDIRQKIEKYESEAEDRKLRSFQLVIEVPSEYHQKVIGPRGATVNELRDKYKVNITLPKGEERGSDPKITITGYEDKAHACAAAINEMISELQSLFTQEISLDARFHPRMIGLRGKNLKKVQDDYQVEIRLPSRDATDPNLVVIAGKDENLVYDCIEHLKTQEEVFLEEMLERGQFLSPRQLEAEQRAATRHTSVQISGAPWQQYNIGSSEEFPDMAAGVPPSNEPQPVMAGAWGASRRW